MKVNETLVTKAGVANFGRLRDAAVANGREVTNVALRFGLEAAIRRIFASEHAHRFGVPSLKGGSLMFFAEGVDPILGRATKDIDLQLGAFEGTMEELKEIMKNVLSAVPDVDDGVRFDIDQLSVEGHRNGGVPGGALETIMQVGRAVVKFKVDVGFYDMEHADVLEEAEYPSLLPGQFEPIRIRRQPIEYAVADKLHAAAKKGESNSRLRDFYDLYVLSTRCHMDDDRIAAALRRVFPLFETEMPSAWEEIGSYTPDYVMENSDMWERMRQQHRWAVPVPDLAAVVATIRQRLEHVLDLAANTSTYGARA